MQCWASGDCAKGPRKGVDSAVRVETVRSHVALQRATVAGVQVSEAAVPGRPKGGLHWPDLVAPKQSIGPGYGANDLATPSLLLRVLDVPSLPPQPLRRALDLEALLGGRSPRP